jgi:hypothetical protein
MAGFWLRLRHGWVFRKMLRKVLWWICVAQTAVSCCENGNESLCFIKAENMLGV